MLSWINSKSLGLGGYSCVVNWMDGQALGLLGYSSVELDE
jgi:hypothetical protein